jgi:hypothetical protein
MRNNPQVHPQVLRRKASPYGNGTLGGESKQGVTGKFFIIFKPR